MLDLYNTKYDREILKKHIYEVKLIDILHLFSFKTPILNEYIINNSS